MMTIIGGLLGLAPQDATAGGSNWNHELAVYSIENYEKELDLLSSGRKQWKDPVDISWSQDPAGSFWDRLYSNCSTSECAMADESYKYEDEDVTVNNMLNGWSKADMVVFWGHNTQITPQKKKSFTIWRPYMVGPSTQAGWYQKTIPDYRVWGTDDEPYRYHRNLIDYASYYNPGAVFYGYNSMTSVLMGFDFREDQYWYTENTWNQSNADQHYGSLGSDTEWIIAHGCNAVQVAKLKNNGVSCSDHDDCDDDEACVANKCSYYGTSDLGVNAWKKSWGHLHTVLGHYAVANTASVPNLGTFANYLKSGQKIKDAYFAIHTADISQYSHAVKTLYGRGHSQPAAISVASGGTDYKENETWTDPMSDNIVDGNHIFTVSYNIYEGDL